MDSLDRALTMLRHIPRYPRKTDTVALRSLLAGMGCKVSLRTIQRDLNKMSGHYPLESDDNRPQGWWWAKNAPALDIPGLDTQSAMVLRMVEEHLESVLPTTTLDVLKPWFESASRVLQDAGVPLTSWPGKVRVIPRGMPLLPPKVDPTIQSAVYAGLLDEKRLRVTYRAKNADVSREYILDPLAVVQRGSLIYLVAKMPSRQQPFQMLLHRMESAGVLDEAARTLPGFDLDKYIADGGLSYMLGPPIDLVLKLSPAAISAVADTPLAENQVISKLESGWFEITATVPNTVELWAWIRGFGSHAELVSPDFPN